MPRSPRPDTGAAQPREPAHSLDVSEAGGVRTLHFGSEWTQGAMRIARPWALELEYTREMMIPLLLHTEPEWPRNALLIGLGAGSLTKFLYRHRPACRITVVEIDPRMPLFARMHFRLPEEDERLEIVVADGAQFVADTTQRYDLILVDGFDHKARAGVLDRSPFHLHCRARLSSTGLAAYNLFGALRGFRASAERIVKAYDQRAVVFPSCDSGNAIAVGAAGERMELSLSELRQRALALKSQCSLNLLPSLSRLESSGSCPGGVLVL